eukprot:jgi/Orpsp1_1/1174357/evm.model.c7180000049796.1
MDIDKELQERLRKLKEPIKEDKEKNTQEEFSQRLANLLGREPVASQKPINFSNSNNSNSMGYTFHDEMLDLKNTQINNFKELSSDLMNFNNNNNNNNFNNNYMNNYNSNNNYNNSNNY